MRDATSRLEDWGDLVGWSRLEGGRTLARGETPSDLVRRRGAEGAERAVHTACGRLRAAAPGQYLSETIDEIERSALYLVRTAEEV